LRCQARNKKDKAKKNEVPEEKVKSVLKMAIGKRLKFVWAAVTSKDKVTQWIFPNAYHAKVAVLLVTLMNSVA